MSPTLMRRSAAMKIKPKILKGNVPGNRYGARRRVFARGGFGHRAGPAVMARVAIWPSSLGANIIDNPTPSRRGVSFGAARTQARGANARAARHVDRRRDCDADGLRASSH
jgi:hypothetical protein